MTNIEIPGEACKSAEGLLAEDRPHRARHLIKVLGMLLLAATVPGTHQQNA